MRAYTPPRASKPLVWVPILVAVLLGASSARAERCVGVFFRGFGASVGSSGMDNLEAELVAVFGGSPARPFSTAVFNWTEQSSAFAFVDGFDDVDCVILAGHSFGANSAIEFATDFLLPAGIAVDRIFLFDSVGANDGSLPANVVLGFNYHQEGTGRFEPQGESNVQGATNVYVEQAYGVSDADITHTEIDCPLFERSESAYAALFGSQPDLYARVEGHIAPLFEVRAVPGLGLLGSALLCLVLVTSSLAAVGVQRSSWPSAQEVDRP